MEARDEPEGADTGGSRAPTEGCHGDGKEVLISGGVKESTQPSGRKE